MKSLLTILTIFILTQSVKSQSTVTTPVYFHVTDTAHYWNYYEVNGKLLWRNVKEYDVSLIPSSGYVGNGDYIKQPYIVKGFLTTYVKADYSMDSVLLRTDINGKNIDIKGRIIHPAILPR